MTKLDLIKLTIELTQAASDWIDTVPASIRDAYFDNVYTNAYGRIQDAALEMALGHELYEDVMWWVYDAKSTISQTGQTVIEIERGVASVRYCLKCDADYFSYLDAEYGLK